MRFTEDFGLKVEEEFKKMEDVGIENETFIRPSKIEVRGRDEGDNHEENGEREKRQKVEGGGGGGGGLLDNLLAKLASPKTPKAIGDQVFEGNTNHSDDNDDARVQGPGDGDGDGGESGGGGVINLISSLFHRSSEGEGEGEGEDVKKNSNDGSEESLECKNESKKAEEESEGGGGGGNSNGGTSFISSLVQDGVAPEADEASILIHSIIHD